jgi:hypothetical protein
MFYNVLTYLDDSPISTAVSVSVGGQLGSESWRNILKYLETPIDIPILEFLLSLLYVYVVLYDV